MHIFGGEEENSHGERPRMDVQALDASGLRVLLVEDNEMNQQVATELLESLGARVTLANHGAEAVKILTHGDQPTPFDVVLMDLQMPEMDGLTATKLLRAEPRLRQLPIIAMTAHAMADEVQRCLDAGMNDHVGKPIDPTAFIVTLMRWVPSREWKTPDSSASRLSAGDDLKLPEIEGVDVRNGLRRVAGNVGLYRELLNQFVTKQAPAGQQIAATLESGDRGLAERRAHSLKGMAGNIGINSVFDSAGRLERAIRDSHSDVPMLIKELSLLLERQVQGIQQALNLPAFVGEPLEAQQTSDSSATLAAIAQLRRLLETNDADASGAYSTLAQLLKGKVHTGRLHALGTAVNGFDFDGALFELVEIAKEYGANAKNG
jgi:CheY-like chemotaxis protein